MTEKARWHGYNHSPAAARSGEFTPARTMATSFAPSYRPEEPTEKSHGTGSCPRSRKARPWRKVGVLQLALLTVLVLVSQASAAYINFENCLDPNIVNSNPKELQFVPLFVWATFNTSSASHNLNVTVYGNVAGIATQQEYPKWNDSQWLNPNDTVGKIPDVAGPADDQKYTTFQTSFHVLDYTPYNPDATRFCNSSALSPCPLTPVFNVTVNE